MPDLNKANLDTQDAIVVAIRDMKAIRIESDEEWMKREVAIREVVVMLEEILESLKQ